MRLTDLKDGDKVYVERLGEGEFCRFATAFDSYERAIVVWFPRLKAWITVPPQDVIPLEKKAEEPPEL